MFLPIFIRLQRLRTEINAVYIQYVYIYILCVFLIAVGTLEFMNLHVSAGPFVYRMMFAYIPASDK